MQAGFANIEIVPQKDLVDGRRVVDNLVVSISIGGDESFGKGDYFTRGVDVVIVYRTFPDDGDAVGD